jgi:hypothetical protein
LKSGSWILYRETIPVHSALAECSVQHGKGILAHSNISALAGGRSTGIIVFSQERITLKEMDLFNLHDFQFLQH